MKACTSCHREYPEASFRPKNGKCQSCRNEAQRIYREQNRDRLLAARREKYAENIEREHERAKLWRDANSESRSASWQKWYAEHREERLDYHREYREEKREAQRRELLKAC